MASNLLGEDVADILLTAVEESSGDLYVVNPSRETIPEVVTVLDDMADPPHVSLLADEGSLKDVLDDFIVASHAADLVASETLAIRALGEVPRSSLLVSPDAVVSIVDAGDRVAGLSTDDESFVGDATAHFEGVWAEAEGYSLRTPPLSRVRETLAADIGEQSAADFDAMLEALPTARGDGEGLDEVTISLLVAARNGELLYDISKWGEDIGLASKATFSRTKTKLEDQGLIDTEKVPIDVGRPRLRLMLDDERLRGVEADELARTARSLFDA